MLGSSSTDLPRFLLEAEDYFPGEFPEFSRVFSLKVLLPPGFMLPFAKIAA
jgi:hypothetical protein